MTLSIVSGNNQAVARSGSQAQGGIATFGALVVKATAAGKPVSALPVTFVCHRPGYPLACQFTPSGTDNGTLAVSTDGNGNASLSQLAGMGLLYYYGSGVFTVTATYGNSTVTFNLNTTQ